LQKTKQQLKRELSIEIEQLRYKLQQLVEEKEGQFLDPEILYLSQILNKLIVKYYKTLG